ncbi:MAG: zinc-finger domain-containing protein [Pseudomonadota bacterium]
MSDLSTYRQLPSTDDLNAPEVYEAPTKKVACDGGGGALGHPRVWLEMGDETQIQCNYCGRLFVLRGAAPKPVTG